ncbi:hypothetical protein K1719_044611 [Acacia pycnantha]|nr:hypothetical protein K1719_044611 [Acacia pycnantha]
MTEAIVEVALETLSSLIQKQLGLFLGVNREMERLSNVLTTIKAVLEDAEEKQLMDKALRIGCASFEMWLTCWRTSWMSVPRMPFPWNTDTRYKALAYTLSIPLMSCSVTKLPRN